MDFDTYLWFQIIAAVFGIFVLFPLCLLWIKYRYLKRQWVGLTDAEIAEAIGSPLDEVYLADFRKVMAKLKEKNI